MHGKKYNQYLIEKNDAGSLCATFIKISPYSRHASSAHGAAITHRFYVGYEDVYSQNALKALIQLRTGSPDDRKLFVQALGELKDRQAAMRRGEDLEAAFRGAATSENVTASADLSIPALPCGDDRNFGQTDSGQKDSQQKDSQQKDSGQKTSGRKNDKLGHWAAQKISAVKAVFKRSF